jgi:hypothetical protein
MCCVDTAGQSGASLPAAVTELSSMCVGGGRGVGSGTTNCMLKHEQLICQNVF